MPAACRIASTLFCRVKEVLANFLFSTKASGADQICFYLCWYHLRDAVSPFPKTLQLLNSLFHPSLVELFCCRTNFPHVA